MLNIVLFEPEIPPNTGNIIRLCANTGTKLHLVEPLGFVLDDKKMRRAGLDYHEWANVEIHQNFDAAINFIKPKNIYAIETNGERYHTQVKFQQNDVLLFGPESRGLPDWVLDKLDPKQNIIRIPMAKDSRSLNLSNSVAVTLYEGLRQLNFNGLG